MKRPELSVNILQKLDNFPKGIFKKIQRLELRIAIASLKLFGQMKGANYWQE